MKGVLRRHICNRSRYDGKRTLVSFISNLTTLLKKVNIERYADDGLVSQVHFMSCRLDATNSDYWGRFTCICSRPRSMHEWVR